MHHAHLQFAHGGFAAARRGARCATMVVAAEARSW
jgi:hypothetical protein